MFKKEAFPIKNLSAFILIFILSGCSSDMSRFSSRGYKLEEKTTIYPYYEKDVIDSVDLKRLDSSEMIDQGSSSVPEKIPFRKMGASELYPSVAENYRNVDNDIPIAKSFTEKEDKHESNKKLLASSQSTSIKDEKKIKVVQEKHERLIEPQKPSQPTVKEEKKKSENLTVSETPKATGINNLRWPLKGRILEKFGQGNPKNNGIDIMAPEGTVVKAAENGVVIYAGDKLKEFGNTILIQHEQNLVTIYGNNAKILVKRGQTVHRGQKIAISGKTGNAIIPQLHFEIRKNFTPVDPLHYLEK